MKNTVIFDLDGLLINSEMISFQLYCDLTAMYGQRMSLEQYIHDYSGRTELYNMQTLIKTYQLPISTQEGLAFAARKDFAGIFQFKGACTRCFESEWNCSFF